VSTQIASDYLNLHLLTPISSNTSVAGAQIEAVVSQPYYQADHQLLYPAGTILTGTVQKSLFRGMDEEKRKHRIRVPLSPDAGRHHERYPFNRRRDSSRELEGLDVGKEGEIKATTSTFARILAPVSLIGPSKAVETRLWRKKPHGLGPRRPKGFGLLGAGAAQASVGHAIGFGYFGAAKRLCNAFLTKGSNVELPAHTPIFLRLDSNNPTLALATP